MVYFAFSYIMWHLESIIVCIMKYFIPLVYIEDKKLSNFKNVKICIIFLSVRIMKGLLTTSLSLKNAS